MEHPKNDFRDYSNNNLMHYGVKGMRWGYHKHPYDEERYNLDDLARGHHAYRQSQSRAKQKSGEMTRKEARMERKLAKKELRQTLRNNAKLQKARKKLSEAEQIKYRDASRSELARRYSQSDLETILKPRLYQSSSATENLFIPATYNSTMADVDRMLAYDNYKPKKR